MFNFLLIEQLIALLIAKPHCISKNCDFLSLLPYFGLYSNIYTFPLKFGS
jgi:hypothetical protein